MCQIHKHLVTQLGPRKDIGDQKNSGNKNVVKNMVLLKYVDHIYLFQFLF